MKKILCATDGSHSAEKAVTLAIRLAKDLGVELTFIHVVASTAEEQSHTYFWDSAVLETADAQVHLELEKAVLEAKKSGLAQVSCATVAGHNIAAAIINYAEANDYNHVVTGSVGRSGVARVLLGSTAEKIISRAHCPVTVAR